MYDNDFDVWPVFSVVVNLSFFVWKLAFFENDYYNLQYSKNVDSCIHHLYKVNVAQHRKAGIQWKFLDTIQQWGWKVLIKLKQVFKYH